MKHTKEEILNALHVIKDICQDESMDCDKCPFGSEESLCLIKSCIPFHWGIKKSEEPWRAFE